MASPYATVDDLHAYLGTEPPPDSQRLLARAQDLVDANLKSSAYVTDANDNPTDASTILAFNKAVCAQVEYWIQSGDELNAMGEWASFSIEGISATAAADRRSRLCDRAKDYLGLVAASTTFGRALMPGKPVI